jgi:hypothetical protein
MIRCDKQLARKDNGELGWYVWVDFNGLTLRSDVFPLESYADEWLEEIKSELPAK